MTNYERLLKEGIVNPDAGTGHGQEEIDKINALSEAEVDHLIAVKNKLGDAFLQQHSAASKSFVVF